MIKMQIIVVVPAKFYVKVCQFVYRCNKLIYNAQFCLWTCFNSSETAIGTSIKLGMIDHHPEVSVIRVLVTSSWRHNQKYF